MNNVVVIGSSGAIGSAFIKQLSILFNNISIFGFSSNKSLKSSQNITYNYINITHRYGQGNQRDSLTLPMLHS